MCSNPCFYLLHHLISLFNFFFKTLPELIANTPFYLFHRDRHASSTLLTPITIYFITSQETSNLHIGGTFPSFWMQYPLFIQNPNLHDDWQVAITPALTSVHTVNSPCGQVAWAQMLLPEAKNYTWICQSEDIMVFKKSLVAGTLTFFIGLSPNLLERGNKPTFLRSFDFFFK